MEEELKKLPLRSVPADYADHVMRRIEREQAKRRNVLVALGAVALAFMVGILATLPVVVDELFIWLSDPLANLAPWFAIEEEAMSNLILIAFVLGIGLCSISVILLSRLNEQWIGVTP